MDHIKPTSWLLLGLLLAATSGTYAQEMGHKARQDAESVARNPADSYEKLLRDAEALVKSGKPEEAYNLLEPIEFEHAGDVHFDYLIGIAALDSGKPDKATIAFERVLAVNPDFAAARLDMARAYYQLGDLQRAKTEFSEALNQNPAEAARVNIQKYLDAIDAQKDGKRTRAAGYLEVSAGRDSNVNNSTSQAQVFVDLFTTMATLDSANVKVSDNYYSVAAGGEINHSLTANWGLYADGSIRKRGNSTHTQFDTLGLDARAGLKYEAKAEQMRVSVLSGRYDLGGMHNSDITGLKGEWRHAFSPGNQLNAFVQAAQYRFVDPLMKPNDVDQRAMGLGWMHVLSDGNSSLSGNVHYGTEKDVAPIIKVNMPLVGIVTANPSGGRNDGAKRFTGLRIGGQTALNERTTLYASTGMQVGDYSKVNYLFLRQRHDRLSDLTMGANWNLNKLWILRPQFSYARNESNIAIYGYDRKDVSLTIRRDFR